MSIERMTRVVALLLVASAFGGCDSLLGPSDSPVDLPDDSLATTVGVDGGLVVLSDGSGVFFPEGSLSGPTDISVVRGDPTDWLDSATVAERSALRLEASVSSFERPVEIRIPLPSGSTPADSLYATLSRVDEESGALEVLRSTVRVLDGEPYLVAETDHFSSYIAELLLEDPPPASAAPIEVPYYNQGSSPHCWAVSVHMVTQAVDFDEGKTVPDILGRMEEDDGVTTVEFRYSSTLASIVEGRTGAVPTRQIWDYVNVELMRYYLMKEIGLNGWPVAVHLGNHAVVVVGYEDLNTFIVHDPAAVDKSAIGYTRMSWDELVAGMSRNDKRVTLVVPRAPAAANGPVRVNFLPQFMKFYDPSISGSAIYHYEWDATVQEGYSFRHTGDGELADPLPGTVRSFRIPLGVQVSNASRSQERTVHLRLDITAVDAPEGAPGYAAAGERVLPPNGAVNVKLDEKLVDRFRYNQEEPTEYLLSFRSSVDGSTVETQFLRFTIESVTPQLTGLNPAEGVAGQVISLFGSGFGELPRGNQVSFDGTVVDDSAIVEWTDTEIRVKVPEGVTSGPVIVKRGEVASSPVVFTVREESYVTSQTFNVTYGEESTAQVTAAIAVEALGTGAGWSRADFETDPAYPGRLTLWLSVRADTYHAGAAQQYSITASIGDFQRNWCKDDGSKYEYEFELEEPQWGDRAQTAAGAVTIVDNPAVITVLPVSHMKTASLQVHYTCTVTDTSYDPPEVEKYEEYHENFYINFYIPSTP